MPSVTSHESRITRSRVALSSVLFCTPFPLQYLLVYTYTYYSNIHIMRAAKSSGRYKIRNQKAQVMLPIATLVVLVVLVALQFTDKSAIVGIETMVLPSFQKKIPLYIITPTSRPSLLTRSIFHVLPFQECFDLHWVIVHSVADAHLRQSTVPVVRNESFSWIEEIFTYHPKSTHGNHERNIGIEHVIQLANSHNNSNGLVYFLDDDNTLPVELCQEDVRAILSNNNMYYADQYSCGKLRLSSSNYEKEWQKNPKNFSLFAQIDTGNWLTPVWLLQQVSGDIRWELKDYASDSKFFTQLIHALLTLDHGQDDRIVRLESVKFHYNELTNTDCPLLPV